MESVVGVRPLEARLVNDPLGAGARDVLLVASAVAALLAFVGLALASRWTLAAEPLLLAEYGRRVLLAWHPENTFVVSRHQGEPHAD